MMNESRCNSDVVISQYDAARIDVMGANQRSKRHPSFIRNSGGDVGRVHLKEQLGHSRERRRPPRINWGAQSRRPGKPEKITIIRVMIGMMVRNEHMPESCQRNTREGQLSSDAVTAIN